jgi:bifunctional DNase/RNase
MNPKTCSVSGCTTTPTVHIQRASNRRLVEEGAYCGQHIEDFLTHYYSLQRVGDGTPRSHREGVAFDVEVVLYDGRPDTNSLFFLREVGGGRRLDCATGPFEVWALYVKLARLQAPRPLTHSAMASVITALGGRLDFVVIDSFRPVERVYEAKLHIQQINATIVVDVRISDAVILAVLCDVPIFVSSEVLRLLGQEEQFQKA